MLWRSDMHAVMVIVAVAGIATALGVIGHLRRFGKTRPCVSCGSPSRFGFSARAESAGKDIAPLCLPCLKIKLSDAYVLFDARALVIGPAANFPCYVFQVGSKWKNYTIGEETRRLLSRMDERCSSCDGKANFLWLTSKGLVANNAAKLFAEGVSETLLRWGNELPRSVCGRCCVDLVCQSIESQKLTFLEVCGPRSEDGFVVPMGY
jgi:hypothetical protein